MRDNPRNSHLPEMAGDIVAVTAELLVDTGLRKVQTFGATLAQESSATEAIVDAVLQPIQPGGTQKLLLQVWAVDGVTPGAAAANVAWSAMGE